MGEIDPVRISETTDVHPELQRLRELEREIVALTEEWAELPAGSERATLGARIALLKRQYISQRIACKRLGVLKEL